MHVFFYVFWGPARKGRDSLCKLHSPLVHSGCQVAGERGCESHVCPQLSRRLASIWFMCLGDVHSALRSPHQSLTWSCNLLVDLAQAMLLEQLLWPSPRPAGSFQQATARSDLKISFFLFGLRFISLSRIGCLDWWFEGQRAPKFDLRRFMSGFS